VKAIENYAMYLGDPFFTSRNKIWDFKFL